MSSIDDSRTRDVEAFDDPDRSTIGDWLDVDDVEERLGRSGTYDFSGPYTTREWEETELYADWYNRVAIGYPNSYTIVVTPSSRTGVSGTGKTTVGTVLAKETDISEEGFVGREKGTAMPKETPYMLRDATEGSAFVIDESQGTPDDPGFDSRRGMTETARKAIAAILANRNKRITVIIIAQQLGMLDPRLLPLIDAWLLITKEPDDWDGPICVHHKLTTNDYELKNPKIRTPAVEDLTWPVLGKSDPDYRAMEWHKDRAQGNAGIDEEPEETELPVDQQIAIAQEYRNMGKSLRWIEDNVESVERSHEWIRNNTTAPVDGD